MIMKTFPVSLWIPTALNFVASHRGIVNSTICQVLQSTNYSNLFTTTRDELDLEDCHALGAELPAGVAPAVSGGHCDGFAW